MLKNNRVVFHSKNSALGAVVASDLHVLKPWIAAVYDSGIVAVWDYKIGEILHQFSLDERSSKEGAKKAGGEKKIGRVHCVKFVDEETRSYKKMLKVSYQQKNIFEDIFFSIFFIFFIFLI